MRNILIVLGLLAANAAAAAPRAATSEPAAPGGAALPDLTGAWEGTGRVQKDENSKPITVRCKIEGSQSPDEIGFAGECRALLIMKRAIGATLSLEGERLSGVYVGSLAGPAALSGTLSDTDLLTLDMTFPREVNGDVDATMLIRRPSDDEFTITTVDTMESGVDVTTSQITFERKRASGEAAAVQSGSLSSQ